VAAAALGIEVGGTRLRAGIVNGEGHVSRFTDTARSEDLSHQCAETLTQLIDETGGDNSLPVGLALAAPVVDGTPDLGHSSSLYADRPAFIAAIGDLLSTEPIIVNDANAAALAESKWGAARGARMLLAAYVGTGLGGAVVADGSLLSGASGAAGEIGHINVDADGPPCSCGSRGCLELYASSSALVSDPVSGKRVDAKALAARARQNDPVSLQRFSELGRCLGVALASVVNILDPDCILLGGGLIGSAELWLPTLTSTVHDYVMGRRVRRDMRIVTAALGAQAGVAGAGASALLARQAAE
jgi:glucokinase